jgi:formate dehydrogenase major subunit
MLEHQHVSDFGTPRRESTEEVTLEIDGQQVTVPKGTSIMRAAMDGGTQIPKLCATDSLEPFGSCRLCLVEVEGRKGYPASCTTPAEPGMKVRTQSPRLQELRKGVMELYISDHPLDCLTCSANGDCELQDMAGVTGLRNVRYGFDGANHLKDAKDESNPYFSYDPSKCIVCNRCVRACEETQGTFALTIQGRGFESRVSAGQDQPFMDSECVSCGACVQACPTATLQEKSVIWLGQPEHSTITTCAYCGVGCGFKAEMKGNEVVRMVPWKDGKANEGHSCVKGRFAWGYATHKDRITTPMIRAKITDPWREVSWEEAIGYAASEFRRIQAQHGKDSIGGITSSRCTNEETYLVQKLIRAAFGNNNVDTCARVCHSPTGLRPGPDLWHVGRHADLQERGKGRRHHGDRRQPGRGAPRVCVAHEAPPARNWQQSWGQADRGGPAPDRPGQQPACEGRLSPAAQARHQRGRHHRAGPCGGDRGAAG